MKEKISVLIIEDHRLEMDRLVSILSEIIFVQIVGMFYNPIHALDKIRSEKVDLIITDVEMPDLDGLSVIRSLGKRFQFIIISGYPDYAVDGFDLDVVDYILKPVTKERLLTALFKFVEKQKREELRTEVRELMGTQEEKEIKPLEDHAASRFLISVNNRIISVPYQDIIYCKSDGDYLTVVTLTKRHIMKMTISRCEEKLRFHGFMRVHKSYIFNTAFLGDVERYKIKLTNGETIPVGKSFWKTLRDNLKGMVK
ncbi:LytTR family DNA-binding domain-containing protein [Olivibacter sp. XZL3]|uniref:LytR/AlgR family response regulator transcription factor n=1 Tax=Olivibacter sp. XZL3 TaxID=1735116 RepID=UPI00106625F5|nr:LytTR family DNA-binding domain-containing protein [Olivibacter sp. XZL3]